MVLLKEAHYVPLALSLAMTQIRNERAGNARRTRFLNRCSTETVGFEPILLKDVQHSFSRKNTDFASALVFKAGQNRWRDLCVSITAPARNLFLA